MCKLNVVNVEKKDRPGCYARAARILTVEDINELKKFVCVEQAFCTGEYYIVSANCDSQKLNLGDWVFGQTLDTVLPDKRYNDVSVISDERMHKIAFILDKPIGEPGTTDQTHCVDEKTEKELNSAPPVQGTKPFTILLHPMLTRKYTSISYANGENSNTPTIFSICEVGTGKQLTKIVFQDGPIKEFGINGVQNEDLIGCVLARLQAFQNGDYKCRENALAITKFEEGLLWLRARTNRIEQLGIQETNNK
ncbi:MAG: hypothetical protein VB017_05585 [Endomicrobiaceae bacterium]|nr:hypothetical protein [Endomicrobiaceae bacterium]